MRKLVNRYRLKLALWLLKGLPENMWVGRFVGSYRPGAPEWHAGRLDARGVLQGYPLDRVFDAIPVKRSLTEKE